MHSDRRDRLPGGGGPAPAGRKPGSRCARKTMTPRSGRKAARIKPPSWVKLQAKADAIVQFRPDDAFTRDMLKGALLVGRDRANPIRGNLLAAAMRELTTYLLHDMAPDGKVMACQWYVREPDTRGPTRRQRATYIVQGGLADAFVSDGLGLDPAAMSKPITKAMDALNKLTHMQPNTVLDDAPGVQSLAGDTMDRLLALFQDARDCRAAVERELGRHVDEAVMDRLLLKAVDELDMLSTHTRVDDFDRDYIRVVGLDDSIITFEVSGTVGVELQYGSGSDVRDDIGSVTSALLGFCAPGDGLFITELAPDTRWSGTGMGEAAKAWFAARTLPAMKPDTAPATGG